MLVCIASECCNITLETRQRLTWSSCGGNYKKIYMIFSLCLCVSVCLCVCVSVCLCVCVCLSLSLSVYIYIAMEDVSIRYSYKQNSIQVPCKDSSKFQAKGENNPATVYIYFPFWPFFLPSLSPSRAFSVNYLKDPLGCHVRALKVARNVFTEGVPW